MSIDRSRWRRVVRLWENACRVGRIDIWRRKDWFKYPGCVYNRMPYTGYKGAPDMSRPCSVGENCA